MDCHNILKLLTDFGDGANKTISDEKLKTALDTALSSIPQNILDDIVQHRNSTEIPNDTSWHYLHLLLFTLTKLSNTEFADENAIFTVEQYRTMKISIETSACIGILPSLLPQIKVHASRVRSKTFSLDFNTDNTMKKYKRLCYTTRVFLELFDKSIFHAAVISHLDCLLAALLQLSYCPVHKLTYDPATANNSKSNDMELHLKTEQESYQSKLRILMKNCPQSLLAKELMVILSIKNSPEWLPSRIQHHLTEIIMMPNGITALTLAICGEVSDVGKCWDKLEITAKLVATSHVFTEREKYYNSICPQILDLFHSKENKQGIIIANACMSALYYHSARVCNEKIINVLMGPLLIKYNDFDSKDSIIVKTEEEVSRCIQNLCDLFLTANADFKCLPLKVLLSVSLPLFYLYVKTYKSIYVLRNQVRQLILKMFSDTDFEKNRVFAIFLNHETGQRGEYGEKLNFCFGGNGAIEISSKLESIDYDQLMNCLWHIVEKDEKLEFGLFSYLLSALPRMDSFIDCIGNGELLESPEDFEERIMKQIFTAKLLAVCSSSSLVQQAQRKNPEPFLHFVKLYYSKTNQHFGEEDSILYEQNANILYTSLLFVKMMLTDYDDLDKTYLPFREYTLFIKEKFDLQKVPEHVLSLTKEIETLVKNIGHAKANFYDLSSNSKRMNEFDKALADLADPLLPVRGHGIITLTKLIESRHPETALKKDLLLCIFQENLDHEDSFIYLAAINGLCAMSSTFPERVLEILVHEFIGLTQQSKNPDVTPETRVKLGEILVKTTRSLGEVTPKYKTLLVNGFLCGTKDPDPLVRASSLSCLGEFCKIMGFRLGNLIIEILYCIGCIIKTDKDDSCRRAGVLVATMLLRGLGKDALTELGENLVTLYRSLKHLRDNDKDPVLQLHAQLALEEFDDIVQQYLFAKPKLEKSIFLLSI